MLPITIMSTLDRTGQIPVQTVPACPVQIRAHHHIDVYTDINSVTVSYFLKFMSISAQIHTLLTSLRHHVLLHMHGQLRLSFALSANYVPKCQMSSGPYGPIFDVGMDIYVMMSPDLYGTCRHCLYGTLSRTCGRNCNPNLVT